MIRESIINKIIKDYRHLLLLGCISVMIGLLVGAIDALFGRILLIITDYRSEHTFQLLPFLPIAGVLIVYAYQRLGKNSLKGMSLIFAAGFEEEKTIPKRLIPLIIVSTWMTHLFGGSAGREGVAVQIGGTVSHAIGRKLHLHEYAKVFIITGMAAGFAGLFQTPFAAIFFALEVLTVGSLEYSALFPSIIASFTASFTSHTLGLEKFRVTITEVYDLSVLLAVKIVIISILFGITGGLFAHILMHCKLNINKIIKNNILRIFIIGIILSVLLLVLHQGRYAGLGTNIIQESMNAKEFYWYDWLLKLIFTIITLTAGFQGGEVTPLFSIGAGLGAALGSMFGLPVTMTAALGYAAVFGSATNTLLAPIFIGAEVFGYEYLPYFFIVCAFAYIFNGNKSIYSAQRLR